MLVKKKKWMCKQTKIRNLHFWLHLCYFVTSTWIFLNSFKLLLHFLFLWISSLLFFPQCLFSALKNSTCLRSHLNFTFLPQIYPNKIRITSLGLAEGELCFYWWNFSHTSLSFFQVCTFVLLTRVSLRGYGPFCLGMSRFTTVILA